MTEVARVVFDQRDGVQTGIVAQKCVEPAHVLGAHRTGRRRGQAIALERQMGISII
ncbi:MAG: hypothetical protein AAGL69_16185 [Pseudomonadota bacterium]